MTNIVLNLVVLALVALVTVWTLRRHRAGPLLWTAVVMVVLTLVFDTIMIAVGLYTYAPDKILGIYLVGAPLEDFAYPLAGVVLLPALWTLFGSRRAR